MFTTGGSYHLGDGCGQSNNEASQDLGEWLQRCDNQGKRMVKGLTRQVTGEIKFSFK